MKKSLLLLIAPIFIMAQAPNIEWQKRIGGSNYDLPYSMCPTSDGGYFLGGYSGSNAGYEKTENCRGGSDYWVVKLDASGNVEWDKTVGGGQVTLNENDNLYAVKQTPDNGYVLCGYSNSSISADKTESCRGANDYWIIKLDSNGVIQWQRTIGGSGDDLAHSIINTVDDGLLVAGMSKSNISGEKTENSRGLNDIWLVKLDSTGNIDWQKTIGGSGVDTISLDCVSQTTAGNFIVAGSSNSGISGEKSDVSRGGTDVWMILLDETGNILSQKTIGGELDDFARGVIATSDGGFLITCDSNSGISGEKTDYCRGSTDRWILKLDNALDIVWQKTYGGDNSDSSRVAFECNDGGFIIGGNSRSGVSGEKTSPLLGYTDAWILKLSDIGELDWQKAIGGTAPGIYSGQDYLSSPIQLADNGFVLAGGTDSDISGDIVDFPRGSIDYWLVKLEPEILSTISLNNEAFAIYPNPITDEMNIRFDFLQNEVEVMAYNSLSQLVFDKKFINIFSVNIPLQIPTGVYYLRIRTGNLIKMVKILKK